MKQRPELVRSVPLIDYEIERGGDGRTVTAYAATFDEPYEVVDFDGHYDEVINRTAFNRTLGRGISAVQVLFNHGRTLAGTPSSEFSLPIAVPVEIKAEGKGLLTRSRYLTSPLADQILEMWREGAIRSQSFRGPIFASRPARPGPNGRPIIERTALGLVEYGPAPFAVNTGADLVAIRSLVDDRIALLDDLSPEERAEMARRLTLDGPPADPSPVEPVGEAIDEEDPPNPGPSLELLAAEAAQRRRRLMENPS